MISLIREYRIPICVFDLRCLNISLLYGLHPFPFLSRVYSPTPYLFHIHIYTHIFSLLVTLWVNGLRYFQMEHDGPSGSWDSGRRLVSWGGLTDLALECFRCSFDRNQVALTQRLCFSSVPMPYQAGLLTCLEFLFSKHSGRVMLLNMATAIWYILWLPSKSSFFLSMTVMKVKWAFLICNINTIKLKNKCLPIAWPCSKNLEGLCQRFGRVSM